MTIQWKAVEQYFTVMPFVFRFYPVCNFGKFIRFGLGTVRSVVYLVNLLLHVSHLKKYLLNEVLLFITLRQVVELQEELKRRESRWSAASTRYRQKVESLEQNNKELQEELRVLEQYRLQQWREEEEHTKV